VDVSFTENPDLTTTVVLINRGLTESEKPSHLECWQASFDNLDRVLSEGARDTTPPSDQAVQQ
jgi:hypothetical protein